jgi:hypothetical protein
MWVESGFEPDAFWHQTPATFTLAMTGVRKRLERELDNQVALAWQSGMFSAAAQNGKLKPLKHYLRKSGAKQTPEEMLAVLRMFQDRGATMKITPLKR